MKHKLYGLRGKAYVAKYKELFVELSPQIKIDFDAILVENGKFSAKSLGRLCLTYQIPVSVMDEWLPEITSFQYASGTWDRLKDRGVKAKDIGVEWS